MKTLNRFPDCWIVQWCAEQNGLQSCEECGDFPCCHPTEFLSYQNAKSLRDRFRQHQEISIPSSADQEISPGKDRFLNKVSFVFDEDPI